MSCRVLLFLYLISLVFPAVARAEASKRIVIGGQIGVGLSTFAGSDQSDGAGDVKYRSGLAGSGIIELRLTRVLSLQSEIGFVVKGQRFETNFPGTTSNWYVSYLEFPVLLRASTDVSDRVAIYGYTGPSFGFLLDADVEYDDGRFLEANRVFKPFDLGLMLGGGGSVHLGAGGACVLDIRYNRGLLNNIRNPIVAASCW